MEFSRIMKTYEGSHQEFEAIRKENVKVRMSDGISLSTDLYFPGFGDKIDEGKYPVILERTPYNKRSSSNVSKGKYFARRGYICAIQDVRGRFESDGEWYAFAKEAPDGYDTLGWIGQQPWSNGKIGTMGSSYAGSDQSALATMNPANLSTMIIAVGASNYHHCSMRQNGALEQRFHIYVFRMAATSKEAQADPELKAALQHAIEHEMPTIVNNFPLRKGTTILSRLPSYEKWAIDIMTIGKYNDYWKQRGYAISEYYQEHADVPTMYLGGWYDSYARATCENYIALSKIKKSDQRLVMGPWTHGGWNVTNSGDVDFGVDSHIEINDLSLSWFDRYMKDMNTDVFNWPKVHIFTMAPNSTDEQIDNGMIVHGGQWRKEEDWPIPDTKFTNYYLHSDGSLNTDIPSETTLDPTTYDFNPTDPVPTIGGGISAAGDMMLPGAFDQRGRSDFHGSTIDLPLNARSDVLSFQTDLLVDDIEVTGPIEMHLWASSSVIDTDFTAKLVDLYPSDTNNPAGLAINITDSIIRARFRNGWDKEEMMKPNNPYEFIFELYPTSYIFRKGHRIRLDISSSNWPRFDVNPNTGDPLGLHRSHKIATQSIYHDSDKPSNIVLPIQ